MMLAARQGYEDADHVLGQLNSTLKPEQFAAGRKLAEAFVAGKDAAARRPAKEP